MIWIVTQRFRGYTSVSTKRSDCQVPNSICPSIIGMVLSGGRRIDLRCEWAFDGCRYSLCFGTVSSRSVFMSSSSAGSFSVRISIPVAWGAKTWTMPFLMPDRKTSSWILSDRSTKSISPFVVKL